jgi:uncharacterized radical SAM superfamily Fe-S cluster-containing enzyme
MRDPLDIPVVVERSGRAASAAGLDALAPRLDAIAAELRLLDETAAREEFGVPARARLLKSTISLCDRCLDHVPALVIEHDHRVLLLKRCGQHGLRAALLENDADYYRLSNKDRWGLRYARDAVVNLPAFKGCCAGSAPAQPELQSRGAARPDSTDQHDNKSCTVLVEVTDACNLACRVCYADSKGDRILPFAKFKEHIARLVALKGSLDSIQITGGEASLHPQFWEMIDWLYRQDGVGKIYLPTNGIELSKQAIAKRLRPYRSKLLVLLQFDGQSKETNSQLRGANTRKVRERLIRKLARAGISMQLTMTLARGVSEDEVAWVVRQGIKHKHIRLIGMLPVFYSGRYDLERNPLERMTLSDVAKGAAAGTGGKAVPADFMPIPCSHPNCGWATLFARRFGLFFNIARHVDLDAAMNDVAYKTVLDKGEMQALVGSRRGGGWQRMLGALGRRLIRPRDVFGIAIKPFMDSFNYDQDRVSACCHHTLDTEGALVSFCEYNARIRKLDPWTRLPKLENA